MTNQSTINKLIEMRLSTFEDALRIQLNDPKMRDIPFEDRIGMLVDITYRKEVRRERSERFFRRKNY